MFITFKDIAALKPSSTLIFTNLILLAYSPASSSIAGAIVRQGLHQGAQKSTNTGRSLLMSFVSNVSSSALPQELSTARAVPLPPPDAIEYFIGSEDFQWFV